MDDHRNEVSELQEVCSQVMNNPSFMPELQNGVTHCNEAVTAVCEEYGISCFRGLMANDIYNYLSKNWNQITGEQANQTANEGIIAIAAQPGKPHGHVAIVYPGAMVWSSKWQKECPVLANVGERNGVMGANWAFKDEPLYFTEPGADVEEES